MISVCMGTYQGEKYIEAQLESIFGQTLPADEVILCDDGSTDSTQEKIRAFIERHGLKASWRLVVNKKNKGYPLNFYYAMSLCRGDYVFLADQDDIWHERKLELMVRELEGDASRKAVCCKFDLIDAAGEEIHSVMKPTVSRESGTLRPISIADVFYKCEWPGMVMAYRGEWFRQRMEQWRVQRGRANAEAAEFPDRLPHDLLVSAWAGEEHGYYQLDQVLAWHRRHDANTGGEEHRLERLLNKDRKLGEIQTYLTLLEAFADQELLDTEEARKALFIKKRVMESRFRALREGRLCGVLRHCLRCRRQTRMMTAICDVMITVLKK